MSTSPNCAYRRIKVLGGKGVGMDVDGFKAKDDEDGKLTRKNEYVRV
jgi:hypothetical protein